MSPKTNLAGGTALRKSLLLSFILLTASSALRCLAQSQSTATLPLPDRIKAIAAIDAQNSFIAGAETESTTSLHYEIIPLKHIYAGGIARLFGGMVIPTALMATPPLVNTGGMGGLGTGTLPFTPAAIGGGTGFNSSPFTFSGTTPSRSGNGNRPNR